MPTDPQSGVYYELTGEVTSARPVLFLGPVLMATQADILGAPAGEMLEAYRSALAPYATLLTLDYPSIGKSGDIDPGVLTADRVCADILSVADHAGAKRFIYFGYSWGASVAWQLAARTDRLDGLIMGGWSPLGAAYDVILKGARQSVDAPSASSMSILRNKAQYRQWVTYYESIQDFDEQAALQKVTCPRLVFAGEAGDSDAGEIFLPIASSIRDNQVTLKQHGWQVRFLPGRDHSALMFPDDVLKVIVPFVREITA